VASCDRGVYAVRPRTGRRVWRQAKARGAYHASPVVRGRTVYLGNDDHKVYALDAGDGRIRWQYDAGSPVWTAPLHHKGTLTFGTLAGTLHCLSARRGELLWTRKAGKRIYLSDPAPWRGRVLVGTEDGRVRAFDGASGKPAFSLAAPGRIGGGVSVAGDRAYYGTTNGFCEAWGLDRRKRLWSRRLRGGTIYTPFVEGNRLYIGTGAGLAYCLDRRTGEVLWRFASPGRTGRVVVEKGLAFAFSWNGRAYALDKATGELQWTLRTGEDLRGFPFIRDGWLYIGSLDFSL